MKKYHLLLLSALSGFLFTLSWPMDGWAGFLFVAFVPLLLIEDYIDKNREEFHKFSVLTYTYPAFFIWNLLTTYWVMNSTLGGGIAAVVFNSLFMSVVFTVYHLTKRNLYTNHGYFVLIFYWISWEYFHMNWDLTWPWLNLGNGFASYHKWIQWYEYTGVLGGTFWVILVNILIYRALFYSSIANRSRKKTLANAVAAFSLIAVPIIWSYIMYAYYEEEEHPVEVVVVQPNLDPYTEQYTVPPLEVIDRNLRLALKKIDSSTKFVVAPESAIQEDIWERKLNYSSSLRKLKRFVSGQPHLTVFIGASTFKQFITGEELSPTARKFKDHDAYYDAYNTVFMIDTAGIKQWYHKSKLTPGVERMPFPKYLKFLEGLAIDMGGTIGSLGIDEERKVFHTQYDSLKVAAIICYESVYGEFTAKFVRNGANLIFIVTNDGWWGNSPGHRQHFIYARLRSIETRRSIARSANTGISAFINQRGDIFQETEYWEPAVIKQKINANFGETFYVQFGDYLARIAIFFSALFFLIGITSGIVKKRNPMVR
ncbi:MAG: apolipoprotein N-acyltransferase [Bacteroidales bacterium]|nr:apolipoprotein N-acyltransferase [Bacteroidales bacterium]MCF8386709.1 apolipoprotein N-acyltransferase [Bacteroidales bacterium]MCF8397218.1 apolipoprotein N-acyltransferase [Bacteroidales bacterium]